MNKTRTGFRMAKRTRLGRIFLRLLGNEKGAVAMEYVVIGVLVVAAAVGAAVYFGRMISGNMQAMGETINGTGSLADRTETARQTMQDADTTNKHVVKDVNDTFTEGGAKTK